MPSHRKRARIDDTAEIPQRKGLETETVFPSGDVILMVGSNAKPILVHSAVLSSASEVFAALLSNRFRVCITETEWKGGRADKLGLTGRPTS